MADFTETGAVTNELDDPIGTVSQAHGHYGREHHIAQARRAGEVVSGRPVTSNTAISQSVG